MWQISCATLVLVLLSVSPALAVESNESSSSMGTAGAVGSVIGLIAIVGARMLIRHMVNKPTKPRTRRRGVHGEGRRHRPGASK